MTGAEAVIKALVDNGVEVIFGYPGGAVLPLYDALFENKKIKHILVRHEQAAVHAAEGYARSTGKVGCVLVTSGPGATNAITGLTDALMDSVPVICLSGQVPTHLIGTDAFQEADTTGISRPCTKHNYLVKDADKLCEIIHKSFEIASSGRPGPVLIDLPKDIQLSNVKYVNNLCITPHMKSHKKIFFLIFSILSFNIYVQEIDTSILSQLSPEQIQMAKDLYEGRDSLDESGDILPIEVDESLIMKDLSDDDGDDIPSKKYGYDFFSSMPTSLTAVGDLPLPNDYKISLRDQFRIILSGSKDAIFNLNVNL